MRIGLDIDGVIYPWHWSIYRYFTEFKGFEGTQREFWTYLRSLSREQIDYYVALPTLYLDTTPTTDVLTYLPKLAELGEIYYITARHDSLRPVTSKFFDNYKLPFKENVIFAKEKQNYARLLKLDCFLDDQPKHVDELKPVTHAYLFKAVHNWESRDKYDTVNSFAEFYRMLKQIKNLTELGYE